MTTITINGHPLEVAPGARVIDGIRESGIDLPGICYKKEAQGENGCTPGSCRVCQVDINGRIATACEQVAQDGMQIRTDAPRVLEAQRFALSLICEEHAGRCLDCPAHLDCALQKTIGRFDGYWFQGKPKAAGSMQRRGDSLIDMQTGFVQHVTLEESYSIAFDATLCIRCGRCSAACPTGAMGSIGRGINKHMGPPPGMDFEAICINCGQCIKVCPTGALVEKSTLASVEEALADASKRVVFQIAPAVRVALGEAFGVAPGQVLTGKIYAALRRLGIPLTGDESTYIKAYAADGELAERPLRSNVLVTDTNVTADLTILEEGTELVDRLTNGGKLPIITSCCPAWVKYMESYYPELSEHVSSAKSPQQMMGALTKTYGAQVWGIDPADIVTVSVMPCTAKKYEAQRPEMNASGYRDVDHVLTTRELARLLKVRGLDLARIEDEAADYPFEEYSGAATIFGNTGGVMEAALRTVHKVVTGEELAGIDFEPARGLEAVKQATVNLNGTEIKIAVVHNLKGGHIQQLLDQIRDGVQDPQLAAVEVMACPGGCIGGGGQPKEFDWTTKVRRTTGLNADDRAQRLRRSHESPVVERIYAEHLEAPNSHLAHELCHTTYTDRSRELARIKEPAK